MAHNEIVEAMQKMKLGKATGLSEISVEMIVASGQIGVKVIMELCQHVLDGRGMPFEWKASVIVPIFIGKSDVMCCGSYKGVKLLEQWFSNWGPWSLRGPRCNFRGTARGL